MKSLDFSQKCYFKVVSPNLLWWTFEDIRKMCPKTHKRIIFSSEIVDVAFAKYETHEVFRRAPAALF